MQRTQGEGKNTATEVTGSLKEALKTGDEHYWFRETTLALVLTHTEP